jgi:hypothetical protein
MAAGVTYERFADRPLFADGGPSPDDVRQGSVGDCYFLAVLGSVAKADAARVREHIVDLGDGTYCVEFLDTATRSPAFVRVDNQLGRFFDMTQLAYADLGRQDSMWVAVMEKAYAMFRTAAGSYASVAGGWMTEAYAALGVTNSVSTFTAASPAALLQALGAQLKAGKSVTFGTVAEPAAQSGLVGNHAYAVDAVITNSKGVPTHVRLRNPWGVDTYEGGNDANGFDGYVTITAQQAFASMLGYASAVV